MNIKVSDFRGISYAEVELKKIVLIAGPNYNGKTSFAQSFGATLTGEPKIYDELTKKTIPQLIRHGKKTAIISIVDEDRTMQLTYPDGKIETQGQPFTSSRIAVGFETIMEKKQKERAEYFSDFLGTKPTYEMIEKALKEGNIIEVRIKEVWDSIEALGWDSTHKKYINTRREAKGKWAGIVEEPGISMNYGSEIAANYLPSEWDPELNNKTREDLLSDFQKAEYTYETCISETAVDTSKIEEFKKKASDIGEYAELYRKSVSENSDMQAEIKELNSKLHIIEEDVTYSCPKCKTQLLYKDNKLTLAEEMSKVEIDRMKKDNLALKVVIKDKEAKQKELFGNMQDLHYKLRQADDAQEELDKIKKSTKTKKSGDKEKLKEKYDLTKKRISLFDMKANAYETHNKIGKLNHVVKVLAEDGLRNTVLSEALKPAQVALNVLCEKAGWGRVVVGEGMLISYINKQDIEVPYRLCSDSERFRIDIILQMLIAKKEGSDVVIIDRADILDRKGGLINLLLACKIPAVVLMTANEKEDVPDLSAHGVDTYWIEDGKTEVI
ncbi:hypothetical protein LCGC14_1057610 [marine sediment metagenome]|uniref:Rad50/SbcC-type AAA domain-containing protein n=1 Tax=marine sediment metagenome TaxID=412755 RepID=A0A0F9MM80_9ZZZZ